MSTLRHLAAALTLAGVVACSSSTSPEDLTGTWGSTADGVMLTISISDATFLAPCYTGKPAIPFLTGSGGNFHSNGILTVQSGAGGGSTQRLVDFTGTLHGDQMTFTVDPGGGAQQLGPYTLQRGVSVNVAGCP